MHVVHNKVLEIILKGFFLSHNRKILYFFLSYFYLILVFKPKRFLISH